MIRSLAHPDGVEMPAPLSAPVEPVIAPSPVQSTVVTSPPKVSRFLIQYFELPRDF